MGRFLTCQCKMRYASPEALRFKVERSGGSWEAPPSYPSILESVRDRGIVNPLIVFEDGDARYVYIGNQRLAAARALGLSLVPYVVVQNTGDIAEVLANYEEV